VYLPKLAEYTRILTPLTTGEAKKKFPEWTTDHQMAFDTVKALVVSQECLKHDEMGENKIFVTCDASD
jgi:hypothetical protein